MVRFRPHPINGWILRLLARPAVAVDGVEHAARWSAPTDVPVTAGRHMVEAFVRYPPFSSRLGTGRLVVEVGAESRIDVRNGFLNGAPFQPSLERDHGNADQ